VVLTDDAIHDAGADQALADRCRAGDPAAFAELVRRHKDRVYNVVYRFVGNHEDAVEVAQEVFVRVFDGLAGFRGEARLTTWLYRIAANLARNRVRDSKRRGRDRGTSLEALEEAAPGVAAQASASPHGPDEDAMAAETQAALQECLDDLPEPCRTAFVLRVMEDLSYEEIARVMECPRGTVKSRLNQARRLLREALEARAIL
jgi:RNA polymerase sigma-70 factor (ECF subfamily)